MALTHILLSKGLTDQRCVTSNTRSADLSSAEFDIDLYNPLFIAPLTSQNLTGIVTLKTSGYEKPFISPTRQAI
jgi:predicted benzoate:H+ symporter BenE